MDQAYRKFYVAYDKVKNLSCLRELGIEGGIYANWFLQELGMAWSDRLEEELSRAAPRQPGRSAVHVFKVSSLI